MRIYFYWHAKILQVRKWKIFYFATMAFVLFAIISSKLLTGGNASEEHLRMAFFMIQYESAILSVLFFATDFFCVFPFKRAGKQFCVSKAFAYWMESIFFCMVCHILSANVAYYTASK